jgi:hypothetical protein
MPWKAQTLKPIGWIHPDRRRPPPNERGYGYEWRRVRARILARDPIYTICGIEPSCDSFRTSTRVTSWHLYVHDREIGYPGGSKSVFTPLCKNLGSRE